MSERDELRERLIALLQDSNLPDWLADDRRADGEIKADAVLAEIERTHVPLPGCECEDCYPELTAAAGVPLPEGITSVTWGWGELPKEDS